MCEPGLSDKPSCHHAEGRQISLKHPCGGKVDISNSGKKEEVVPHQRETTVHLDVQVCLSAFVSQCPSFALSVASPSVFRPLFVVSSISGVLGSLLFVSCASSPAVSLSQTHLGRGSRSSARVAHTQPLGVLL